MRLLLLPVLGCSIALLGACRKPSKPTPPPAAPVNSMNPGDFLDKLGKTSYTEFKLKTELILSASSHNVIQWQIVRTRDAGTSEPKPMGGPGGSLQLASPAAAWFMYMEDDKNFWFFNGTDALQRCVLTGGTQVQVAIHQGKIHDKLTPPPEVILRLPAELQKLYPPVEPKSLAKPPSI